MDPEKFLEAAAARGSVLGLANMAALTRRLGYPQNKYKVIHVAGTNGKGSVTAYIAAVLAEAGYRTGAYRSPAVFDDLETIEIDGKPITREFFAECVARVAEAAGNDVSPTRFEAETAAAFLAFSEASCDFAVIETGLGGAEDATNVTESDVCDVVTQIGLDHTAVLGSTIEEIAAVKSGIIKKGAAVVTTCANAAVGNVIAAEAERKGCTLITAETGEARYADGKSAVSYKGREYATEIGGLCRKINLPIAVEACRALGIDDEIIERGIARAVLRGRCECVDGRLVLDGAHNPDAAASLRESVKHRFAGKSKIFLLGVFEDKDYRTVIRETVGEADEVVTFDWDNPRALSGRRAAEISAEYNAASSYKGSLEEAVAYAFGSPYDIILVYGSFSHLARAERAYKEMKNV